jgi:hypothetical protein
MTGSLGHKDWVGSISASTRNTLTSMIYTTIKANMHETIFYLVSYKKFLLALIFYLTQLCLNTVTKVGVSQG